MALEHTWQSCPFGFHKVSSPGCLFAVQSAAAAGGVHFTSAAVTTSGLLTAACLLPQLSLLNHSPFLPLLLMKQVIAAAGGLQLTLSRNQPCAWLHAFSSFPGAFFLLDALLR
jgi:hypothetical protein